MTDGEAGHMHGHGVTEAPDAEGIAIDPVCGMKVDTATAKHRFEHDGRPVFFCSARCREKFIAAPANYLTKAEAAPPPASKGTIYTCPMHPQIRQDGPGSCPICGMALEPLEVPAEAGPNAELIDMTRRFWIGLVLALPVVVLEMGGHIPALGLHDLVSPRLSALLQFALATPVVLWAGWPFFERAWASVVHRSLNMFTLIALGHRRGLSLQPGRDVPARHLPGGVPRHGRHGRRLFRGGGGHHRPGAARARCWSCARASRPAARSGPCSTSRPRPPGG